ncbi:MAG: bifunctional diaminohydroxyphosphoribosylaminopyrimidine deaminase/5-amino-6-(5-phosphoribosylamino)uracil reductase RibD, partial [Bdellovibrionales bacterium]|nr:bifunctional diaminohydroxyphosphoribosylaminopyrimidine deaminase/5-amino-6-(5-phosphoribosylamino)uracil reductase RibD [Bdellovibrionales bacterium]
YMLEALELADAYRGFCAPNPAVGAVVIKDGQIVGKGAHRKAGTPHAEVEALAEAGELASGATLVVTLEPCCHWGKTPPCTELIKEKGIARVLYGYQDPNPVVLGEGKRLLQEAGLEVQCVALDPVKNFYESYSFWRKTGRPFVTAKLALSLDGRIAGQGGQRVQLTGESFQRFTHRGRLRSDAILSTVQTVLADDPQLNARLDDQVYPKPVYILDRQLRVPREMRLLETASSVTVFFAEECDEMRVAEVEALGVRPRSVPTNEDGSLSLEKVMEHIGRDGCHDLWLESGGKMFQAMLQAGLVEKAYLAVAPKWIGNEGTSAFSECVDRLLAGAASRHWTAFGNDGVCELRWN